MIFGIVHLLLKCMDMYRYVYVLAYFEKNSSYKKKEKKGYLVTICDIHFPTLAIGTFYLYFVFDQNYSFFHETCQKMNIKSEIIRLTYAQTTSLASLDHLNRIK